MNETVVRRTEALDPDAPAEAFDDSLHDRQAESVRRAATAHPRPARSDPRPAEDRCHEVPTPASETLKNATLRSGADDDPSAWFGELSRRR